MEEQVQQEAVSEEIQEPLPEGIQEAPDTEESEEKRQLDEIMRHLGVESVEELLHGPSPQLVHQVEDTLQESLQQLSGEYPALFSGVRAGELAADEGYVALLAQGYSPLSAYLCRYTDRCLEAFKPPVRPSEGALHSTAGGRVRRDVAAFSEEEMAEIRRAVKRGERVTL